MDKRLIKIRKIVERKFDKEHWQLHMLPMIEDALQLAKIYKVDKNLVELAALMHDIGLTKNVDIKNHQLVGIPMAVKILKEFKYDSETIKEISHCIESHRSSKGPKPKTLLAKIIANADATSHFDAFLSLFYFRAKKHNFEETVEWVKEKIERNWQKKLTLPVAKKLVRKKYLAIKIILENINK
jgi:uncharacterized protein